LRLAIRLRTRSTLLPYTTLFRSGTVLPFDPGLTGGIPKLSGGRNPTSRGSWGPKMEGQLVEDMWGDTTRYVPMDNPYDAFFQNRSEEHTSELQSRENLVCRLLLE